MILTGAFSASDENPKRSIYQSFALLGRALGNVHRLEILDVLAQGERAVEGIARHVDISIANASQHLQALRRAGLVAARRQQKSVLYRLADPGIVVLLSAMRRIAEQNIAEVQRTVNLYFGRRDTMEPVTRTELLQRLGQDVAVVIDVRPRDEFAAGHIPGALNLPIAVLKRRLAALPKRKEIVAYCRGPYCVFAFEAVETLRRRGFRARRLEDGFPEWRAAGLPVTMPART